MRRNGSKIACGATPVRKYRYKKSSLSPIEATEIALCGRSSDRGDRARTCDLRFWRPPLRGDTTRIDKPFPCCTRLPCASARANSGSYARRDSARRLARAETRPAAVRRLRQRRRARLRAACPLGGARRRARSRQGRMLPAARGTCSKDARDRRRSQHGFDAEAARSPLRLDVPETLTDRAHPRTLGWDVGPLMLEQRHLVAAGARTRRRPGSTRTSSGRTPSRVSPRSTGREVVP